MSALSTNPGFRDIGHTQRGVALVMAVLIVAIIVTATTFLAFEQQLWIRQSENIADHALTESVRRGALEGALIILSEDAKDNITDDLEESWHSAPLGGEVGSGMFIGQIDDAQGRFNLNSLVKKDGQPDPKYLAVFRRLLSLNDIDPNLADAVVDWIDADGQQRPYGAEDISYLGQQIPYRAANQSFSSVEELVLVQGFDAEMLNKLRDYLTALPEPTPININTAPAEVLKSLDIKITDQITENIITKRNER